MIHISDFILGGEDVMSLPKKLGVKGKHFGHVDEKSLCPSAMSWGREKLREEMRRL